MSLEPGAGSKDFKFERLEVYQRAKSLARGVYRLTGEWSKEYQYDLSSQFRRASLSIILNIAEGSGRSKSDFSRYLVIAKGSCKECAAIIDLSRDLGLIHENEAVSLRNEIIEIAMMLEGLKKSLK